MSIWQIKIDSSRPWDAEWTTRDGRMMRIGDMDRSHRVNLLAFLESHAAGYKQRYWLWSAFGPQPSSDGACDAFDSWLDEVDRLDAVEWLNSLAFVKALRVITPSGPGPSKRRWQNRRAALRAASQAFFLEWLDEVSAA